MPKLPDPFGPRPSARSNAPITVDRSGEILGEGLVDLGRSISRIEGIRKERQDRFSYARAKAELATQEITARRAGEESDDWAAIEKTYREDMQKGLESATKLITDKNDRAIFEMEARLMLERGAAEVSQIARKKEIDWGRADVAQRLEDLREAGLNASDEATRAEIIGTVQDILAGGEERGYYSEQEAGLLRRNWTEDYAEGFIAVQHPAKRIEYLKSPKGSPAEYLPTDKRAELLEIAEKENNVLRVRAESQAAADDIIAKHGSLSARLKAAHSIKDPEVRDAAVSRVKERANEEEAIKAEAHQERFDRAATMVEAGRSTAEISARDWVEFSLPERRALEARYDELHGGKPVETDWQVYYGLIGTANVAPDEFRKIDLRRHFADLGETERKELIKLQGTLLGEEQTEPSGLITRKDVVDDALESMGVTTAHQKGARRAEMAQEEVAFRRAVDDQIRAIESNQGKPATVEQIQDVVDRMTLDVRVSRAWRTDPSKRAMQLTDDERQRAYVELGKVPEDDVAFIRNMFLSHGSEPTDEAMGRAYFRYVENDREGFLAVVEGRE